MAGGKQSLRGFKALPRMRTPPAIPRGPNRYRPPKDKGYVSDFSVPPPGFLNGQTSQPEWMLYLAFSKILGYPANPREPPFIGFPGLWGYQVGGSSLGQSKIDFVVYPNRRSRNLRMAFRLQSEYFHNYVDAEKHAYDIMQMWRLSEYNVVVDLYDFEFADDPTGQAAITLIKRGLNGELWSPTTSTGVAQRVRPGRRQG